MNSLPTEILQVIFQSVSTLDLLTCARVCKVWQDPAYRIYYETLWYSNRMCLLEGPSPIAFGRMVQTLSFERDLAHISQSQVTELLSFLINLRSIEIHFGIKSTCIIQILKNNVQYVPHVQQIKIVDHWPVYQMKVYFEMVYAFRNSLRHIHVYEVKGKLMKALPEFKRLSHLYISNIDHHSRDPEFKIFSVLSSFPHLVCYGVQNYYEESQPKDIKEERIYLKLKTLKVETPLFLPWHINYMTRWLELNKFQLIINSRLNQWYEKLDTGNLDVLGNYLKKLQKVDIILKNEVPIHIPASYTTYLAYWPMIKPLVFTASNVIITIDFDASTMVISDKGLSIKKIGNNLNILVCWNTLDFPNCYESFDFDAKKFPFDQIHELNITECYFSIEKSLNWINCLQQKFTMLKKIWFNKSYVDFSYNILGEIMVINRAAFDGTLLYLPKIKILKLDRCVWKRDEDRNKNKSIILDLSLCRLDRLELVGADFFHRAYASMGDSIPKVPQLCFTHILLKVEQPNETYYFESKILEKQVNYPVEFKRVKRHRFFCAFTTFTIKCLNLKELLYNVDTNSKYHQSKYTIHLST